MGAPMYNPYSAAPDFSSPWRKSSAAPARNTSSAPARKRVAPTRRRGSASVSAPTRRTVSNSISAPGLATPARRLTVEPARRLTVEPARTPTRTPHERTRKPAPRNRNNNVRVVRGSGTTTARNTQSSPAIQASSRAIAIVSVAAVLLVMLALLSFARVAISSATISTAMSTQAIASELETAKSEGNQLEVSSTVSSNATAVTDRARALGMNSADQIELITLPQDVVAQDSSGNLLLAESIRRAGNEQ